MLVLTDSHFTIKISDCLTENRIKKQVVSSESRVSFSVHFRYKGEWDCTLIGNTQTQHITRYVNYALVKHFMSYLWMFKSLLKKATVCSTIECK